MTIKTYKTFPLKKFIITNEFKEDAELFKQNKITPEKLCKKYGISRSTLRIKLLELGIRISRKRPKQKPTKSRYFQWSELKDHIMCNYNN